jgi:4-amino-4-deoxy-L-arabinose transferase-like glycosyltransferase
VEAALVVALLLALAAELAWGIASDGLTNDEVLYVSAGYRQLALGDFRLSPTHPPLAPSLAALGLLGLRPRVPPLERGEGILEWCRQFVLVQNDAGPLVARARVPVAAVTVLLALLLWGWARALAGPVAGLAALFLVAFHPSVVAHGHLATTDAPATAFTVLAAWAFWFWLRAPGPGRALLTAAALGLAVATRATSWAVLPVALVVLLGAWRDRARPPGLGRASLVLLLATLLVVPAVLWAAYGLHDTPWPEDLMRRPRVGGAGTALLDAADALHVVPVAYTAGLRFQLEHAREGHVGYLLGERRRTGWWSYGLVALAVKNTPGFLLALAGAAWAFAVRRVAGSPSLRAACALSIGLALVVLAGLSLGRIQIGERYLLPAYPFLILLAAVAVPLMGTRWQGKVVLLLLALAHAGPTLAAAPGGTLAYFNALAGGREGGHRVLVDSNLDWGQDLPRLASWMRREGVARVQLAYQGSDDPARFGIDEEDLPGEHLYPARPPARPFAGVVVVSPNLLVGLVPRLADTYAPLRARKPDARAGVFFVYRLGPG